MKDIHWSCAQNPCIVINYSSPALPSSLRFQGINKYRLSVGECKQVDPSGKTDSKQPTKIFAYVGFLTYRTTTTRYDRYDVHSVLWVTVLLLFRADDVELWWRRHPAASYHRPFNLVVGFSRWNVAPNYPRQTLTFNYPNLLILEPELDLNTIEGKEKIHFRPSIYVHVHACPSQYSVGRGLAVPLNTARQYARRNSMPPFPRGPWIHHSSRALRDGIHFRHTPIVSPVIVAFYKEGKCEGGVGK